jgi:Protein of unknown function (DUF2587)
METAQITRMPPGQDEAPTPVRRFVVIVGEPADGGSAFRIEDPARLLRVWSLLRAVLEQLDGATLPPEGMPGLQRQLQAIRREVERALSPPLVAELRRILPSHDATPSAGALRIESAVLASWVSSLVLRMLGIFATAPERAAAGARNEPTAARQGGLIRPAGGTFAPGASPTATPMLGLADEMTRGAGYELAGQGRLPGRERAAVLRPGR